MLRLEGRPVPVVGRARVYVCGITPYDTTHLGHAATFVWGDVAARVLRHAGVDVEVCRNVTDVDDVLDAAAALAGSRFDTFAAVQQFRFDRDMAALGVRRPTHEPRAHNFVPQVEALAAALLEAGAAYERGGTVWFRGAGVAARAGLDATTARALAREFGEDLEVSERRDRDDWADVAVWRAAGPGAGTTEPAWPSPWGDGRPGWHAECAAMALTTFGPALDLHVGGADLRYPHHAYEAAMAEAVTGVTPFARAWMHIGIVQVGGEKMAKSAGNLVLVGDVVEQYPPAVLRLLLIDRPWAQPWDFEPVGLDRAADRLERLYAAAARGTDGSPSATQRRHGRAVGEPGRAGGPGGRRDGRRGGGPAGAVGARPELSRPAPHRAGEPRHP